MTTKYMDAMVWVTGRELERSGKGVVSSEEAQDVVNDLIVACLERGWLARAAPQFGRFRDFLITITRRFAKNYVRSARAHKRRPKGGVVSLDYLKSLDQGMGLDALGSKPLSQSPQHSVPLDEAEMECWIRCMLMSAADRLQTRSPINAHAVQVLLAHGPTDNQDLALMMGVTKSKATLAKHRGRRMLEEELEREVRQSVSGPDELRTEYTLLRPVFERTLNVKFS